MTVAILDARQWQQTVDLRTGRKIEAEGPVVDMVRGLLARHPFPGDCEPGSNTWVVDTALDLMGKYKPSFAFLTLARQYYASRYNVMREEERQDLVAEAFAEAERFARESGFLTILVGTGGMAPPNVERDRAAPPGITVPSRPAPAGAGRPGRSVPGRRRP